jgi:serine phosphatase RsbU (regulator of sigma subunit)
LRFPLLRTVPGKLFLLSSIPLVVLLVVREFVALPDAVEVFRKVLSLGFLLSIGAMAVLVVRQQRHRFLWRVRRKLLVSYVLLGFVPVMLVAAFMLFSGIVLYYYVSGYVFQTGLSAIQDAAHRSAEIIAQEGSANPQAAKQAMDREFGRRVFQYPDIAMAIVPVTAGTTPVVTAGTWKFAAPPADVPTAVVNAHDYRGFVPLTLGTGTATDILVIRAAVPLSDGHAFVVVDLPIDQKVVDDVHSRTGMRIDGVTVTNAQLLPVAEPGLPQASPLPARGAQASRASSAFRETYAQIAFTAWSPREPRLATIHLTAPISDLYDRLASAQPGNAPLTGTADPWTLFVEGLLILGLLFLIIQASAFIVGGFFARQITSAVHDLFAGTERVQQGDFGHRIPIRTQDQLGDLADSFNRMSESIERLLRVERDKQRLDDELRIARDIQQSLLPVNAPEVAGLDVAALCVPAREVGGDYYDFFRLGPRQLGVLMADVSGKGTSAALYMAEVKGLMLSLTQSVRSPRQLLIDANRLLSAHLDNRSFVTMSYAIIDLEARTLTCARAGHTPLLVVSQGASHLVSPDGMVLGLRLPGADTRFEELLEEHTRPIHAGDVMVLFTDGITEAMNPEGDLFGESALAASLARDPQASAATLRDDVVRDVRAFAGTADQHDDMTIVVLRVDAA